MMDDDAESRSSQIDDTEDADSRESQIDDIEDGILEEEILLENIKRCIQKWSTKWRTYNLFWRNSSFFK